ncbi:MAG: gamma-glutamyltransferase family protein [Planctomycetes bacterium]|nr:gamma-glutamyltransferase family protein [Planctomycetota bacterium]MCP4838784.1 gamma-glutamyltransferase family protein [Planctomycetota bacterium]
MTLNFSQSLPDRVIPGGRMPVIGRSLVATSHPLAAQVGLDMLNLGGNAADAAIATAAALTVVEPTANGLGSDAFAISWDGHCLHGLNASGKSPAAIDVERLRRDGIPRLGWDSITVPGCVSAWVSLWKSQGTLPFPALLAPAIDLARDGFPVSPQCAESWQRSARRLGDYSAWMETFTQNGRTPKAGECWTLPDHAHSLELIAQSEGETFYQGDLAEAMVADAASHGAHLSMDDLRTHKAIEVDPWSVPFGDVLLHELPPNGQGLAALVAAGVLDRLAPSHYDADDPALIHLQIESMKIGFADAAAHVADPEHIDESLSQCLSPDRLDQLAASVDVKNAADRSGDVPKWSSTVYLCVADATGRAVSFIQSNYEGFGSGIVIPGTGIAMQNRGAGFVDAPGHPNDLAGGKRPYHTIIPGFTTRDGSPHMAFGVMGGPMQPQGHLQVLSRVVAHGWDPQAAIDAPRWRVEGGRRVCVEPDLPQATIAFLLDRGHTIMVAGQRDVSFGGAQVALRLDDCWCGGSDGRRDGQAVVR